TAAQAAGLTAAMNGSFNSGGHRLVRYLARPVGRTGAVSGLVLCHGFPIGPLDARQMAARFRN
ncbi:MAG: hypothetical protein LH616_17400, partial [Ilumatobacteraceae bacterium]|nr:hypothetical protein [Ilumatobacteraceae bacterium]